MFNIVVNTIGFGNTERKLICAAAEISLFSKLKIECKFPRFSQFVLASGSGLVAVAVQYSGTICGKAKEVAW